MCTEVYLYDSETKSLVSASCNPSGARPVGLSSLTAVNGDDESADYRPRDLIANGMLFLKAKTRSPPALVVAVARSTSITTVRFARSRTPRVAMNHFSWTRALTEGTYSSPRRIACCRKTRAGTPRCGMHARMAGSRSPPRRLAARAAKRASPRLRCLPSLWVPGARRSRAQGNMTPAVPAVGPPKKKTAADVKAGRLAKALKQCAKDKRKAKRTKCQKQARGKYGAAKKDQQQPKGAG